MKKMTALLCCALILFSAFFVSGFAQDSSLSFGGGKFRILVLSDTQDDQNPAPDMLNLIEKAIEETSPDLIVFTGDLIEDSRPVLDFFTDDEPFRDGVVVKNLGKVDREKTLENVKTAADAVLSVFQASGVPFAIVQGNNDYKAEITNEEWLEFYSHYSNCLTFDESDDAEGRIDYHLEITDTSGADKFNLWIMDTGRHGLNDDQVDWYSRKSSEIRERNGGEPVPAIAFQHIQADDIGNLFTECSPFDEGARAKGLKFYRLDPERAAGYNFFAYAPCEPTYEFKAWKEQGDVIGAYFGHQHIEGFTGTYDGIEMGFNYGAEMAKSGPYGYRLITLDENDLTNYENEMYTYEGSVKRGDAHFEKQTDVPYGNTGDTPQSYILALGYFARSLVSVVIDFFASL